MVATPDNENNDEPDNENKLIFFNFRRLWRRDRVVGRDMSNTDLFFEICIPILAFFDNKGKFINKYCLF